MDALFIIARVVLGLFFVFFGVSHFHSFKGMVGYSASKKIPAPTFAVALTGLLLIVGGVFIIAWWQVLAGVIMLAVFLLGTAVFMHNFWSETDGNTKAMQRIQFLKNIALAAALLVILALYYGASIGY